MAKTRKKKVSFRSQYLVIGKIYAEALRNINQYFEVKPDTKNIRCKTSNSIKHNRPHLDEIEKELEELGLNIETYAKFIAQNYNCICLGNKPKSVVLVVKTEGLNHMAAVELTYYAEESFWLMTTTHVLRSKDLVKMTEIWNKVE